MRPFRSPRQNGRVGAGSVSWAAALSRLVASGNAEWALRLAAAQPWFWDRLEQFSEGRESLEAALKMPQAQAATPHRGRAAYAAATLCHRLGDYASALRHQAGDALPVFRYWAIRRVWHRC
jgi:hypothetical protein